jgi:hypothetical protein
MAGSGDMVRCLEARAAFLESRSSSAALAQEKLTAAREILNRARPDAGVQTEEQDDSAVVDELRRVVQ